MDVTEDLVRHVAQLARLDLTEEEVRSMQPQLARIFEHVEGLQSLDVGDADPATLAPIDLEALRDDVEGPTLTTREVMGNAPDHDGFFIVVPRFFDDDGGASDGEDGDAP